LAYSKIVNGMYPKMETLLSQAFHSWEL